jgi:ABC-type transport system,membrane ATPase component
MDMKSEEIVGDLLAKIKRDKIIIIITHRKYLLSMCDEIITLNA